jgi:hypothetical protein
LELELELEARGIVWVFDGVCLSFHFEAVGPPSPLSGTIPI